MYKIIGSDNLEYGPVSADVIRQWIAEGRLNAQSRLCAENSTNWLPLSAFPEFAAGFTPQYVPPPPSLPPSPLPAYAAYPSQAPETNKLAIAGFVCSILGLPCCCGMLSIPGLIMSCIALGQIRRNPSQRGNGLAVAGIIISAFGLVCFLVTLAIFIANPQGFNQMFDNLK